MYVPKLNNSINKHSSRQVEDSELCYITYAMAMCMYTLYYSTSTSRLDGTVTVQWWYKLEVYTHIAIGQELISQPTKHTKNTD